jgi:hypothetical protein
MFGLFLLAWVALNPGPPGRADGGRDLSKYDNGGVYDLTLNRRGEWPRLYGEAREFIWSHWRGHALGWLRVNEHSVDAWADCSYFVEPDSTGKWCVRMEVERARAVILPPYTESLSKPEKSEYEAYQLERLAIGVDPRSEEALIPENTIRAGQSYTLLFKSRKGDLLFKL